MIDPGFDATEKLLKALEKRIDGAYNKAYKDVRKRFLDYMRRFRIKDNIKRKAWEAGVITKTEYVQWRMSQMAVGKRWADMSRVLAEDLQKTSEIAREWAQDAKYTAFAENANFATYVIENTAKVDLSYTLYSHDTVERLIKQSPKLIPAMNPLGKTAQKIAQGKAIAWDMQKVSSALTQGILTGESIPKMASRLRSVAQMDHNASIRNARTMVTGAQNAGRLHAENYAKSKGVETTNVWSAALDMRTRHAHRLLDGQRKAPGEPFVVPDSREHIMFPGDPSAAPQLVYNCRCALVPQVKGFEYDIRSDPNLDLSQIDGMTYEEWKHSKVERPNRITLPEEKAKAIQGSYINEYRQLSKETLAKSSGSGKIEKNEPHPSRNAMSYIGNIDKEKYKCVTDDIKSDRVIVTGTQIAHIKQGHPEALESLFKYGGLIVSDPDYILEANKPNTAVLLKKVVADDGNVFQMILRLQTSSDPEGYDNSVITFLKINEKRYNRYTRAKKVLYKKENL